MHDDELRSCRVARHLDEPLPTAGMNRRRRKSSGTCVPYLALSDAIETTTGYGCCRAATKGSDDVARDRARYDDVIIGRALARVKTRALKIFLRTSGRAGHSMQDKRARSDGAAIPRERSFQLARRR